MKEQIFQPDPEVRSKNSKSVQDGDSHRGPFSRRNFLITTTTVIGVSGAAVATWPFIASWRPSARAKSGGAPVQIDLSHLEPGARVTVMWQGKPVWVVRRTLEILEDLSHDHLRQSLSDPDSQIETQQPAYAQNALRAIKPEFFVVIAICTHLGCVPLFRPDFPDEQITADWMGGFFCPCHKSKFDLAGRVYRAVPAPTNLAVPPHRYLDPDVVEIGFEDKSNG